jgi:hypothetical protein
MFPLCDPILKTADWLQDKCLTELWADVWLPWESEPWEGEKEQSGQRVVGCPGSWIHSSRWHSLM